MFNNIKKKNKNKNNIHHMGKVNIIYVSDLNNVSGPDRYRWVHRLDPQKDYTKAPLKYGAVYWTIES